ncbi:LWR-salt protein [Halostella sp. JP-L12]|uniref:LWR-salt protein n=1 Tax=Halostella TaxID=1843185 RepID=UPI000EF8189B|nr:MULTISPECIES: LWR-salt protein [Halostella]NHN47111.1 LWR-salt protein [Halostella sp. JP-L12]
MHAEYVFRVRVRIDPSEEGVRVDPATFETTLYRRADPPGEDGWLFFRDNLWRGEVNDEAHLRDLAEDSLGVPVDSVAFSALRTDEAYFDALKAEIGNSLDLFKADRVSEVVSKYLGSSVEVRDTDG